MQRAARQEYRQKDKNRIVALVDFTAGILSENGCGYAETEAIQRVS